MATVTPATLTQIYNGSTYVNLTDASPGATATHSYILRLPGYADVTGNVTVTAGSTTTLSATFTGNASFSSNPTGAEIWVDGTDTGFSTPNTIQGLVQGTHSFILKLAGFQDFNGSFSISPGTTTTVPLSTFAGSASLSSIPTGAEIYLAVSPNTPIDQSVTTPHILTGLTAPSSGSTTLYNYTLKLTGYADVSGSFTATAGSTISIPVTFPPSANFISTPSNASIYIDNVLQSGITPNTITGLSTGSHDYRLTLAGYADYTGSFTANAGSTSYISATFAGSANITSVPTGAEIYLAVSPGTPTDQGVTTPHIITGLTAPSQNATTLYNYTLTLVGYADISGSFEALAGSTTSVPLTFPGSASFTSTPSGAEIWVDGIDQGLTTPNTVTNLSAGSHSYTLKLAGYKDTSGSFSITSGSTTTISVTFPGSAYFTSTPSNARIYVDGSNTLVNTPGTITGLSAGTHTYRLTLAGYADYTGSFDSTDGTTTLVSATFAGSAYVSSTPSGASIYLDGSNTPVGATPYTITGLSTGSHSYILKLNGYSDYSGSFTATDGTTTAVSATFAGSAYFTSTPSAGEIYLATSPNTPIDQGVTTPHTFTGLTAPSSGSTTLYNYTLKLAGYADTSGSFTATAGSTINVPVTFPGSVYISSTPGGSEIYIDGVDQGLTTPNTITGLSTGSHTYRLTLAGYTDTTGSFIANSGSTANVSATFAASVSFASTPSGAEIYIDGLDQGLTTPNTITGISAGEHTYRFTHTGYQDVTGTFTAISGQTVGVSTTFPGSAYISSTPEGSEIYIDGVDQLLTTPNTITGLSTGSHTYRLTLVDYQDVTGSFNIFQGTTTSLSLQFTGNLNISSLPSLATVYLDGSNTPLGVTPTSTTGLIAGTHSYRLTLTGYADATGTFSISPGSTTNLSVTFSGSSYFTSTPSGARIYVDGIDKGVTTPNTITGLSAGSHSYRLTLVGYADATGTFNAISGQTYNAIITFAGSANITSIPTGAEIYLAISPSTPTDQGITTPHILTGLTSPLQNSTTLYNYTLKLAGYADTSGSFTALAGSTISVPVTFPGSAYISSNPSGAEIYVDGFDQHLTTPNTIIGLSTGSHTYRLTLAGFADTTGSFSISAGFTTSVSSTFLGSLEILSNPSGASIYLDSIPTSFGTTPRTITGLSESTHSYILQLTGYATLTGIFPIINAETTILSETFPGSLYITSTPSGAKIYIDDVDQGLTTPNTIVGLTPTTHNVKLTLTNYFDWTDSVSITEAQTLILNATLVQRFGSLQIYSYPAGANIYIDNIFTGITSPIIIGNLTVGSHNLRLSHIDYEDVIVPFTILSNQTTIVTETLPEVPEIPYAYGYWDSSAKARLRIFKCKKIDLEQTFLVDAPTLSFDYQIVVDADPETVRWQLIVGGNFVIDEAIPVTSYGTIAGTITRDVSAYVGSTATIKFYLESGSNCELYEHQNTYLYIDNVVLR